MKKLLTYKTLWLLLLLPLFSGCNDSDDVQAIFTGKTWRLTYINKKNEHGMMSGFTNESIEIFKKYQDAYTISFTGVEEDSRISGSLSGKVITASLNGTWSANGKDNQFSANVANTSETDGLALEFIKGLNTASSYSGDANNLFLYYTPKGSQQTFVLAFHVKKNN